MRFLIISDDLQNCPIQHHPNLCSTTSAGMPKFVDELRKFAGGWIETGKYMANRATLIVARFGAYV